MRVPLVAAVALAVIGATLASRSEATPTGPARAAKTLPPVLGISYRSPRGTLAWFDSLTLRMLPGRKAPLGGHTGSWAFSADRAVLAIANCGDAESREIRFVNARAMRVLGDLRLSLSADCTSSLTWFRPRRLLAVVQTASDTWIATVDPVARRVLHREPLASRPWATGQTRSELVLLLGTDGLFAPARVAAVDAEGTMRVVTVDRILAGTVVNEESSEYRARTISPGLAIDPDGRRAFLVPASGPIAEIDLATLAVSYHEIDRPSLLRRLVTWLTPSAQAKMLEGPVREARWLGDGKIAVSGMDYSVSRDARGQPLVVGTPAGLSLVDTGSWTSRELSRDASGFAVGEGLVIAQGGRWDSGAERGYGPGLQAFDLDGRERWKLHSGEYRWIDTAGPVGYAYVAEGRAEIVDLATGLVLGVIARDDQLDPWPQLLAAQASGW